MTPPLRHIFSRESNPNPERVVIWDGKDDYPITFEYAKIGESEGWLKYLNHYMDGETIVHRYEHTQ